MALRPKAARGVFLFGIAFLVDVLVTVYDLFFLKPKKEAKPAGEVVIQPAS